MPNLSKQAPWLLSPVTLEGKFARLEPLTADHHGGLSEALEDGELWNLWYTSVPHPEQLSTEIERRLMLQSQQQMLAFTVIDRSTEKPVGMTTFMNIDVNNHRLEIGYTWYAKSVQRTAINTECKYLLLQYAFEVLCANAVEFRTHFFNQTSRKAIERLGAKLDGILRSHMVSYDESGNKVHRDTCVYSIIASEWPAVKQHLGFKLQVV